MPKRAATVAGAGLGDDAGLAHALGKQDLTEAIVDLVRTGVVQLVALEIDLCAAQFFRQALGEIKRARPASIMGIQMRQFRLEFRIGLCLFPLGLKVEDQWHQRFGNEAATEDAEAAVLVRTFPEGIGFGCFVHLTLPDTGTRREASATAAKNSSIICRSLTPGALSTPEETSIPRAPVSRRASAMLSLLSPPESM